MTNTKTPTPAGLKLLRAIVANGGTKRVWQRFPGTSIAAQSALLRDGYLCEMAEGTDANGEKDIGLTDKGANAALGIGEIE